MIPAAPAHPAAVAFADAAHGWIATANGIYGTRDGRPFRLQSRRQARSLVAVGPRDAWALAGAGVLRTTDGATWRLVSLRRFDRAAFAAGGDGVGVAGRRAYRTRDGGRTWHALPGRADDACLAAGEVVTARGGTVTRRGRSTRLLPTKQGFPVPELSCRAGDAWVVLHEGAAAGSEGYVVFASVAAGPWRAVAANLDPAFRRLPRVSNTAGPLEALGRGAAVLVGTCGPCGRRQPTATIVVLAGRRVVARSTPFDGFRPDAVSFVDRRHGFLATSSRWGEIVWRTADGGRRWTIAFGPRGSRANPR